MARDQEIAGVLEADEGLLEGIVGVVFGAGEAGDFDRVLGFGELEGSLGIGLDRLILAAVHDVLAALQQFELGVDLLDGAGGVVAHEVLGYDDVAGLGHGEVGLGGDDQAEGLQVGGGQKLGVVAVERQFAEINGAPFGSDAPQHEGHVFGAELVGRRHVVQVSLDLSGPHLALDFGFAFGGRHEFGAAEIDVGGTGSMVVIDGLGGAGNHRDPENRGRATGHSERLFTSGVRNLCQHSSNREE